MQVFNRILALAGLLGLLVVVVGTGRVHGTQEPGPARETIVYSSIQPSNWDLYLFAGPGSEPRRLTTDPGLDYNGVDLAGRALGGVHLRAERQPGPVRARSGG